MANIVKSVEFVELDGTGTLLSYNLTKGQDYENCVPFFTNHGDSEYIDTKTWDCYFTGTTESGIVNFERYNSRSASATIRAYIVEFDPDEVYVEQGAFSCNTVSTHVITTTSGFVANRTGMVHYWKSDDTSNTFNEHFCRGRVTDDGELDFYRAATGDNLNGHWFIFEAKNGQFTVEHYDVWDANNLSYTLNKSYDPLKTFVITSQAGGSSTYISRSVCRSFLTNRGAIAFDKAASGYTTYNFAQIIEFQDSKVHVPAAHAPGLSSVSGTINWNSSSRINIPADLDYSMVISASKYIHPCNSTAASVIDESACSFKLDNEYQISFTRNSHTTNIDVAYFVVDWIGYTVDTGTNPSPPDPNISFVKSVQNTRIEIDDWQGAQPLTKGQNLSNCIVFASAYCDSSSTDMRSYFHEVFLSDTGMVCARRARGDDISYIDVSVVEFYPDQVKVQSGTFNIGSMTSEITKNIPEEINKDKSFLLTSFSSVGTNSLWSYFTLRSTIASNTELGFYKYSGSDNTQVTWFLAEDITDDNSCFDVDHQTIDGSATSLGYISSSKYFPTNNTFLICNGTAASVSVYADRSNFVCVYQYPNYPVNVATYSSAATRYIRTQAVRIRRSGKHYVLHWSQQVSSATDETLTKSLSQWWDSNSYITAYNTNTLSFGRTNSNSNQGIYSAFWTIRITDLENLEFIAERSTYSDAVSQPAFCFINWLGHDSSSSTNYVKGNTLIASISYKVFSGLERKIGWYMEEGQNPASCVPFATWSILGADGDMRRSFRGFSFEYEFGLPHKLYMHKGANEDDYSTGTTGVYVVEFNPDMVKVQQGSTGYSSNDFTVTIEEVDLDRAFLVFYSYGDSSAKLWREFLWSGTFDNSTTLRFRRSGTDGNGFITWYVAECLQEQWKVQHLYTASFPSTVTTYTQQKTYRTDPGKTWTFVSYANNSSNLYMTYAGFYLMYTSDNNVNINRNTANSSVYHMCSEVIEFSKEIDLLVLVDNSSITTNPQTVNTFQTNLPLSNNRTIVFNSMVNNLCKGTTTQTAGFDNTFLYNELIDFNNLPVKVSLSQGSVQDGTLTNSICITEFPPYKTHYFEGYVTEESVPVVRDIYLYRSDTGELMDTTTSISGTGYFRVETTYSGVHHAVCLDDEAGESYNHLIYGKIYPDPIENVFNPDAMPTTSGIVLDVI